MVNNKVKFYPTNFFFITTKNSDFLAHDYAETIIV